LQEYGNEQKSSFKTLPFQNQEITYENLKSGLLSLFPVVNLEYSAQGKTFCTIPVLRQEITHLPKSTDLPKINARMLLWAINGWMTTISTNLARHLRIPNTQPPNNRPADHPSTYIQRKVHQSFDDEYTDIIQAQSFDKGV
jgi:hypothetical protein